MTAVTRREILKWSAMCTGALCAGLPAFVADEKPKKILFFTKSSEFEHDMVKRKNGQLGFAEKVLTEIGKKNGFEVTASKDGGLFTAEKLEEFNAFVFYTTGILTQAGTDKQPPMPPDGKQVLLDAVAGGKGFMGLHCASDTFHSKGDKIDPYIAMLGGEFIVHGQQQTATARVIDRKFPGAPEKDLTLKEEWYALKNFASDLHVILKTDTAGMTGDMYKRDPYPSTWARNHGKGKVFYTSLGHREDVWTNSQYHDLLINALSWVTTKTNADITPNMEIK